MDRGFLDCLLNIYKAKPIKTRKNKKQNKAFLCRCKVRLLFIVFVVIFPLNLTLIAVARMTKQQISTYITTGKANFNFSGIKWFFVDPLLASA